MEKETQPVVFIQSQDSLQNEQTRIKKYIPLFIYSFLLLSIGLSAQPLQRLIQDMLIILQSPSNLVTDYFELASFGSAFFNSGLLTLVSLTMAYSQKVRISGPLIASIFSVSGFSFFGKNIYNSIPIILGVYLYSRFARKPFSHYIITGLFGSSLSPIVSYLTFGLGLPLIPGILLGTTVGVLTGLILPPLASHFLSFHQGFSLYNVGFTSGIIAMMLMGILRLFDFQVLEQQILSNEYHDSLLIFLFCLFGLLFLIGLLMNYNFFSNMKLIARSTGKLVTDFISIAGVGATLINMSTVGLSLTLYVTLIGGIINGPILGGLLTVVGFSAFGVHLKNSIPVLVGVYLASHIGAVIDPANTNSILTALFAVGLAPISGYYGVIPGLIAGLIHMMIVGNLAFLHGGLNLYNNGFSSGFVAAFLVPLFDNLKHLKKVNQDVRNRKSKTNH